MVRQIKFVGLAGSGWFVLFVIFLGCSDSESDRNGNMDSANDPAVSAKKSVAASVPSQPKKTKTLKGREADAPQKTPQDDPDVNRKKRTEELQYSLQISNFSELAYDADDAVILGGASIDGTAMVYANDSPVHLYNWGGQLFAIQYFLDRGKNTVRVEVDCKKPIFAKIVTLYPMEFKVTGEIEAVLAELQIGTLTGLKELSIHCGAVTDEGLDFLSNLKSLTKLDLSGTRITDKTLTQLQHLKHLERLELKFTKITQDGCKHLAHPEKLKWLDVGWTDVDDLSFLSTATRLEHLGLSSCAIADDQLRHVRSLPRLQHLDICDVPLTGAGLRHLNGLESLAELNLLGASLTDEALDHLHDLASLRHLRISGRIDDGAIARLKDALPHLATFWCDASQTLSSEAPTPKSKRSAWAAHDARSKAPQKRMYDYDYDSGVHGFSQNGKYGFKTSDGRIIAPARFDWSRRFSEGLAAVELGGKWGFLDLTGALAVQPRFDEAYNFSDGLAAVKLGDTWGYVDRAGMLTIPPRFDVAQRFSQAHAAVVVNGKQGFINTAGAFIIEPMYDLSPSWFSEGVARVSRNGKWGFVNVAGKEVIPLIYQGVGSFSEGLAAVRIGNKWGYIDRSGRIVVEPQFDGPGRFANGQARVDLESGWIGTTIDRTGKIAGAIYAHNMR